MSQLIFKCVPSDQFLRVRQRYARRAQYLTPAVELSPSTHHFYLGFKPGQSKPVACGYAINHAGWRNELVSLFNAAGKGFGYGEEALRSAEVFADSCTIFDGFLTVWYAQHGWYVTAAESFDEERAPFLWDVDIDGRPDVLTLARVDLQQAANADAPEPPPSYRYRSDITSQSLSTLQVTERNGHSTRLVGSYTNEAAEAFAAELRHEGCKVEVEPVRITAIDRRY